MLCYAMLCYAMLSYAVLNQEQHACGAIIDHHLVDVVVLLLVLLLVVLVVVLSVAVIQPHQIEGVVEHIYLPRVHELRQVTRFLRVRSLAHPCHLPIAMDVYYIILYVYV
jgi:hypothetical protein